MKTFETKNWKFNYGKWFIKGKRKNPVFIRSNEE